VNNWGEIGHYSTMATVLYLAGYSTKDAKAIALAAWAPDTDKRSAMSTNSLFGSVGATNNSQSIHLLDNEKDLEKVITTQENLAKQVSGILGYIKQIENNPTAKAAYLSTPAVQNVLHSFGDAFAHVQNQWGQTPLILSKDAVILAASLIQIGDHCHGTSSSFCVGWSSTTHYYSWQ
jgi:filamentous hemagglutinin